jgi:hypothetical protein
LNRRFLLRAQLEQKENDDIQLSTKAFIYVWSHSWFVSWLHLLWSLSRLTTMFKVKITSLFTSFYELRYLLINDIIRSIFKWQQNAIKQKVLINTAIRWIKYLIFITRFFYTNKIFRTTKNSSNSIFNNFILNN